MRLPHRPDWSLNLYSIKLRTTDIVVVLIEQGLETDRKVPLCSRQGVSSAWSSIVDASNTIHNLATQECIGFCDDGSDARIGAVLNIQLGSQQVTCQTANSIIGLGATTVHGIEHASHFRERVYIVIAQENR